MKVVLKPAGSMLADSVGTCSIPDDYEGRDYAVKVINISDDLFRMTSDPVGPPGPVAAYFSNVSYTLHTFKITTHYIWGKCLVVENEEDLQYVPGFKFREE
jgi:hypothetical protein